MAFQALMEFALLRRVEAFLPAVLPAAQQVTGEVWRLIVSIQGEMKRTEIQQALNLKHEDHFRLTYLLPALEAGLIEMTVPDKPRSSRQKYRLTKKGRDLLSSNE